MNSVDPNYKRASNFILIGCAAHIASVFLLGSIDTSMLYWIEVLIPVVFALVSAFLISKGYNWMKWIYTIVTIYYLSDTIAGILYVIPIVGVSFIGSYGCIALLFEYSYRITAVIVLFKIKRRADSIATDINPVEQIN
jgi:hypothetical protein